jgi:hypothetical protein
MCILTECWSKLPLLLSTTLKFISDNSKILREQLATWNILKVLIGSEFLFVIEDRVERVDHKIQLKQVRIELHMVWGFRENRI